MSFDADFFFLQKMISGEINITLVVMYVSLIDSVQNYIYLFIYFALADIKHLR